MMKVLHANASTLNIKHTSNELPIDKIQMRRHEGNIMLISGIINCISEINFLCIYVIIQY